MMFQDGGFLVTFRCDGCLPKLDSTKGQRAVLVDCPQNHSNILRNHTDLLEDE